ncbi:hypothetical protein OPEN69S_00952 [Ottowia pentelensis]
MPSKPKSQVAAEQARPVIAVAGVSPATGDAPSRGDAATSRSEWSNGGEPLQCAPPASAVALPRTRRVIHTSGISARNSSADR